MITFERENNIEIRKIFKFIKRYDKIMKSEIYSIRWYNSDILFNSENNCNIFEMNVFRYDK